MSNSVSVLMAVYYRELPQNLDIALRSVFNQTLQPEEVVLVKDGPLNPELDAVIEQYCQEFPALMKVIALPENVGLGKALNAGLKNCSNELVARMDSDDISKPTRFEKQESVFQKHPEFAVVGAWVDEFYNTIDNVVSVRRLPEESEKLMKFCKRRCPFNHPVVMFRKSVIEEVGNYQDFYLFEDYYLWARLVVKGFPMYNIQESLLFFRSNPQMILRRGGWKYAKSEIRLQRRFLDIGLINVFTFSQNVLMRFLVRIMPNKVRHFIYKNIIRSWL